MCMGQLMPPRHQPCIIFLLQNDLTTAYSDRNSSESMT